MELQITSKTHPISDHLKEHIEEKMDKLEKYIHGHSNARVVLDETAHLNKIEIFLHANHHDMRAEAEHDDAKQCIDKGINKIEAQLRKVKEKKFDNKG